MEKVDLRALSEALEEVKAIKDCLYKPNYFIREDIKSIYKRDLKRLIGRINELLINL